MHLAEQCRLIRNFGDSGKFQWDLLGFNYRLNEVAAAIGICQLAKLEQIIAMRRDKARRYDEALAGEEAIVQSLGALDRGHQLSAVYDPLSARPARRESRPDRWTNWPNWASPRGCTIPRCTGKKCLRRSVRHRDRGFPELDRIRTIGPVAADFHGPDADEQDYVSASLLKVVRHHRKGAISR